MRTIGTSLIVTVVLLVTLTTLQTARAESSYSLTEDFNTIWKVTDNFQTNLGDYFGQTFGSLRFIQKEYNDNALELWGYKTNTELMTKTKWDQNSFELAFDVTVPKDYPEAHYFAVDYLLFDRPYDAPEFVFRFSIMRDHVYLYNTVASRTETVWEGNPLQPDTVYTVHLTERKGEDFVQITSADGESVCKAGPFKHDALAGGNLRLAEGPTRRYTLEPYTGASVVIDNVKINVPVADRPTVSGIDTLVTNLEALLKDIDYAEPAIDEKIAQLLSAIDEAKSIDPFNENLYTKTANSLKASALELSRTLEKNRNELISRITEMGYHPLDISAQPLEVYYDPQDATGTVEQEPVEKFTPATFIPSACAISALEGVPFLGVRNAAGGIVFPKEQKTRATIDVNQKVGEIYLHLDFDPFYLEYSLPDFYLAEIRYADGTSEKVFPLKKDTGKPEIDVLQPAVYVVTPAYDKIIESITVDDCSAQGGFILKGITLKTDSATMSVARLEPETYFVPVEVSPAEPIITVSETETLLKNNYYEIRLNTENGVSVRSIVNVPRSKTYTFDAPSPFFKIKMGEALLTSLDFTASDANVDVNVLDMTLEPKDETLPLVMHLRAEVSSGPEIVWQSTVENTSEEEIEVNLIFPYLEKMNLDAPVEDTYYYFPYRAGLVSTSPIDTESSYGGMSWMQVMDIFDKTRGGGIYLYSKDSTGLFKIFSLRKNEPGRETPSYGGMSGAAYRTHVDATEYETGIGFAIQYPFTKIPANGSASVDTVVMGVHTGGWKEALEAYRNWTSTWYVDRNGADWFDYGVMAAAGQLGNWEFADKIGGFTFWHNNYWGSYGDAQAGAAEGEKGFLPLLEEARRRGEEVGVYTEGMLMSRNTQVAKEHGTEWQMLDDRGDQYNYYYGDGFYYMCPAVKAWQEYDAKQIAWTRAHYDIKAYYLDSIGSRAAELCFNPDHNHPTPGIWIWGGGELFSTVRRELNKVDPEAVIKTEEPGCDYFAQFLDGSWSHTLWTKPSGIKAMHPELINYFRFYYPQFKMYEIPAYYDNLSKMKASMFNGEGMWVNNRTASNIPYIRTMNFVLRENNDAFFSDTPECLVPTGFKKIYMNMYPGKDKTMYTFFSDYYRTMMVPVTLGEVPEGDIHVVDVMRDEEVPFEKAADGTVRVTVRIDPFDTSCIGTYRKILDARVGEDDVLSITADAEHGGEMVKVVIGNSETEFEVMPGAELKLTRPLVGTEASQKKTIKLFKGQFVLDEVILD